MKIPQEKKNKSKMYIVKETHIVEKNLQFR